MRNIVFFLCAVWLVVACYSTKDATKLKSKSTENNTIASDTVRIANDEVQYEIIIIEPGFNAWVQSVARPEGYYSQQFLENRNLVLVYEWNRRVLQPMQFNPNLYMFEIDYQQGIDYGYEVNYLLYNYFVYFQMKYKQRLSGFTPRI